MTTRILPPEEWPRLAGTLLASAWPLFTPSETRVVVVERDGAIVGCVALFARWHLEGAWIHPSDRGRVSVGRRLRNATRAALTDLGATEVLAMARNAASVRLCQRFGRALRLACDHFAIVVGS